MAMGSMHQHGRWRHRCCRPPKRELAGMCRQANALQQLQAFIAGGGLIAFQHFTCASVRFSMIDRRGKQLEVLEYHAHAGTQFRQIGFLSFTIMPRANVLRLLHRLRAIDGLNQRGFTGTRWPADYHHTSPFSLLLNNRSLTRK